MITFYLVRHAQADYKGNLTEEGEKYALLFARGWAHNPPDTVFSSPVKRCHETALIIVHALAKEQRQVPLTLTEALSIEIFNKPHPLRAVMRFIRLVHTHFKTGRHMLITHSPVLEMILSHYAPHVKTPLNNLVCITAHMQEGVFWVEEVK